MDELVAEFFDVGKAFEVVGVVTTHFENADDRPLPFYGTKQVVANGARPLLDGWRGKMLTGCKEMFDLVEDPGIADGGPADHDAVDAVAIFVCKGFFGRIDVSITEDRNMNAGILFHFCNEGPVGFAFVKLGARAAVNGEGFDADILQPFCNFLNIFRGVIPAQPRFYGDGKAGAFYNGIGETGHSGHILQHGGAGAFAHHFLDGTAEIDIDQVGLYGVDYPGTHGHCLFVSTKDLDAERTLIFKKVQLCPAFNGITDQSLAGNEFAVHQVCAILLTHVSKRRIAHIFHGCEEERECRNLYLADVYHDKSPKLRTIRRISMSNNLKIRSPWSQLGLFLGVLLGFYILYSVLAGVVLLAKTGLHDLHKDVNLSDPALIGTMKWLQALSSVIVFGCPSFFYGWQTFRERPLHELGFRPASMSFYVLGVLLLLLAMPLEGWLGQLNKQVPLPRSLVDMEKSTDSQILSFLKIHSPIDIVVNLFVMALLPAIFEELCFRGALQRILMQCFRSPWSGIVVSAVLFAAFHMQFQGFLPRVMLGVLLGAAYWYSGSLWTPILGHFFFNGVQVIAATYYPKLADENPDVSVLVGLGSLVIVVGLLVVMKRQSTASFEEESNLY